MRAPHVLLLTDDGALQNLIAEALSEIGGVSHFARDVDDALANVCGGLADLDVAIIDFQRGAHGMTLLSALKGSQEHLPVIAIVQRHDKHIEALAYATGASVCLAKPFSSERLINAVEKLHTIKPSLAAA